MKKTGIRISVIIAVFVIALIFFSKYYNQGTTDMTMDMSAPTLPVAYVMIDGQKINEMHGYVNTMDCSSIRSTITPVAADRNVSFTIDKYGNGVLDMRVEVRSADGLRLIEDTQILHYNDYSDHIDADIQLKDLIDDNREYNLMLCLTLLDEREVYYYTRIIENDSADTGEKLDFVLDFCRKTFDKNNVKELSTYMEPSQDADNTNLGRVGIDNSMNQLTWGDLPGAMIAEGPRIYVREIGDTMASVELRYLLNYDHGKERRSCNVTEYYRIRKTDQRFYLLSFSRDVNEIFVMDKDSINGDRIELGIQGDAPQIVESEGGEIVAFENAGRLYSYNVTDNKLIRLFAFFDDASDDYRMRYRDSSAKILDVEENGNVSFIVYGYMNRGIHEGRVGIEVYYYDSILNTVEEQAFIPYDKSADILECDMNNLSFLNAGGDLFIFLDGIIYKIIPRLIDETIIARNVNEDTFFASKDQNVIVWQEPDDSTAEEVFTELSIMSLTSGDSSVVKSDSGDYIKPIGFMNDDLIYGECRRQDLIHNQLGDVVFPMNRVIIQSESGEILKEYNEEGIYVTSGRIEDNQMTLYRVARQGEDGDLTDIPDDHITSNIETKEGKNILTYVPTEEYEKLAQIKIKNEMDLKSMMFLTPKEVLYEGGREIRLESSDTKDRFMVYGDGEIVGIFDKPAKAVAYAYDIRGTVMDIYGNEIYRRGEILPRNQIMAISERSTTESKDSLAVCLDTMLGLMGVSRNTEFMLADGQNAYDILGNNLGEAYILNLTGCPLDVTLYYANRDIPVLAYMDDKTAVLIIGFNEQNIVLMDPTQGTIYKVGRKDARDLFEENGNRFLTYVPKNVE